MKKNHGKIVIFLYKIALKWYITETIQDDAPGVNVLNISYLEKIKMMKESKNKSKERDEEQDKEKDLMNSQSNQGLYTAISLDRDELLKNQPGYMKEEGNYNQLKKWKQQPD
ncbi:hypothetical protein I7I51_07791 [Histoplasma capsulatum]|uniref:Uncharacterized protein n=1 Tax=Ajellomyces capsulatus TaxID=5037 RepID=A0A8A1M2D8_AJECA|nr:hypothetical protein I7I51_07791 [Histoplasma capsulatum]